MHEKIHQKIFIHDIYIVKLLFTTMCFVGFYSVPNLIIIMFNLLYPVFHVGFICKGCVWERESVWRLKALKTKHHFVGSSWVSIPQSDACALHMTEMRRVRTGWRQLVFASISRVRPSCETLAKHSILPNYHFWYTLSVPILYIPTLPTDVEDCFWEKTLATNLES